jgi:hypothetical protein
MVLKDKNTNEIKIEFYAVYHDYIWDCLIVSIHKSLVGAETKLKEVKLEEFKEYCKLISDKKDLTIDYENFIIINEEELTKKFNDCNIFSIHPIEIFD